MSGVTVEKTQLRRDEGSATSNLRIKANAKHLQVRTSSVEVENERVFANRHWTKVISVVLLGLSTNSSGTIAVSSPSLCGMDETVLVVGMNVSRQGASGVVGLDASNTEVLLRRWTRACQ